MRFYQPFRIGIPDSWRKNVEEPVVPGSSEAIHLGLELLCRHLWDIAVRPYREVDPGVAGLTKREPIVDRGALEAFEEELLELLPELGVEPLSRRNNQYRDIAIEDVPTHEHPNPLLLF